MNRSLIPLLLTAWLYGGLCHSAYLTPAHLKQIEINYPDYLYAERLTGAPWRSLASLHWRESEFKRRPGSIGGAFGLDMGEDNFEWKIYKYEQKIIFQYKYPKVNNSVQVDFRLACLCAGAELISKLRKPLYNELELDHDALYDAMWGYNGRDSRHGSWRGSPYTANDPQRGKRFKVRWARRNGVVEEYEDTRPGAVMIYRELKKISFTTTIYE